MADPEDIPTAPDHFTRAITELGNKREVLTTSAIFNENGVKIAEKGVAINSGMYERLMQHKLSQPIENSVSSLPTVNGEILRQTAEDLIRNVPFFGRLAHDTGMRALLLDAVAHVPLPAPIAFQATLSCELRHEAFVHSVQAALIAAWLAKTPTSLRFDVGMAAAAALLHDLGMLHLDPILMQPEKSLSRTQRRQLYTHSLISTLLLKRHHEYPKEVIRAVEEHHEYLNGSGYPRNLSGDAISPLGRILGVAEVVSAMFGSDRAAPEMRLSVLLRMNKNRYDAVLVDRIMQLLRPEQDAIQAMALVLDDPVKRLCDIEEAIAQWPSKLIEMPGLSAERLHGLHELTRQILQLQRTLATVGIAREQLLQIGDIDIDDNLKVELSMLALEAAWQLRAMARQARRRWRAGPDGVYPSELQNWLDKVDAMVTENDAQPDMDELGA